MIQALIRDLSFWDAIPPISESTFPSPLPKRPENVGQLQRQAQHQSEPGLGRGRNASSRDPEGPEEHFQRLQKRRSSNSRSGQSSSSHGNLNSKGTIDDLSSSNSSWRQLPPPVWKAAVDPMTGRTYYYDSVTRRTQWEKVRLELTRKLCSLKRKMHNLVLSWFGLVWFGLLTFFVTRLLHHC